MPLRSDDGLEFGERLRQAMVGRGLSVKALARLLAEADGTEVESKRRWLAKVLGGDVQTPEPQSLRKLEAALQLPASTFRPPQQKNALVPLPSRREGLARLEALEAVVEENANDVREALAELDRRIRALEGHPQTGVAPQTR